MAIGFDPKMSKVLPHSGEELTPTSAIRAGKAATPEAMEKPKGAANPKTSTTHPSQLGTAPTVKTSVDDTIGRLKDELRGERTVRERAAHEALNLAQTFALRRTRGMRQRALVLCDDVGQQLPSARQRVLCTKTLLQAEADLHALTQQGTAAACQSLITLLEENENQPDSTEAMREVMARCKATLSGALVQLVVHFPHVLAAYELSVDNALSQALFLAEEAILLAPQLAEGHAALGRVLLAHPHPDASEDAREALVRALALDPEFDPADASMAALLLRQGQALQAWDHAERLVGRGNNLPHTMLLRALILAELGRSEDAQREIMRALKLAPDAGLLHLDAARLAHGMGDEASAQKLEERARELLGAAFYTAEQDLPA